MAASIYKPGEFFRKHQLQGTANKQTTSEEVIVDVTGEEENEERSFKDLENDIADNDRGGAKTTTRTCKRTTTQHQGKKKETKEVFMDSRESRRSLFASWASELSDNSFNCLLLALRERALPPCENISFRVPVSLTLQGRVPLSLRGTLFSCKQALNRVNEHLILKNV